MSFAAKVVATHTAKDTVFAAKAVATHKAKVLSFADKGGHSGAVSLEPVRPGPAAHQVLRGRASLRVRPGTQPQHTSSCRTPGADVNQLLSYIVPEGSSAVGHPEQKVSMQRMQNTQAGGGGSAPAAPTIPPGGAGRGSASHSAASRSSRAGGRTRPASPAGAAGRRCKGRGWTVGGQGKAVKGQ